MARNRGAASSAATIDEDVAILLLRHSLRSTVTAAVEALVLLLILVAGLRTSGVAPFRLGVWAGAVVANLGLYSAVLHRVSRQLEAGASTARLRAALTVVQVIAGTCWGVGAFVAESGDQRAAAEVAVAIVMIASGNLIYSASTPGPFLGLHLPLCVLGVAGLAQGGDLTLGLMVAFTGVSGLPLRKELHRTVLTAIETARRNERLAQEVQDQHLELERINLGLTRANVELSHRATTDSLTQLANRHVFTEHLESLLVRRGGTHPGPEVGVIYFDIDRFKSVNDTLGHAAGDSLLQQVARRVSACLREADLLARLGGDEFVIVVPDGGPDQVLAVAHRVHDAFREPFEVSATRRRFTASIGVASGDLDCSADDLVARADAALYLAKESGRDQVRTWDSSLTTRVRGPAQGDAHLGVGTSTGG